jgi:23S rRNA (adenine-N6)-dimethyltransferase
VASPSRPWGWHRLDADWAERLVTIAGVRAGDRVVDIGAGTGAITAPLLDVGARVIAIEVHPQRAQELRERFGRAVVVVQTDARDLRLPRRPFSVVSNPPFSVSAPLLRRLLQPGNALVRAHLVLQTQVVRRWTAADAPGRVRWARSFTTDAGAPVPRRAFRPRPPADARILRIHRR